MPETPAESPFHDLAAYVALPRLTGLVLSPDGSRLVATVSAPDAEGTRYTSSLWELDPAGEREARRLTRSAEGESSAAFLPDGGLLFLSKRPAPPRRRARKGEESAGEQEDAAALWLLPPDGGEARRVAARAAGLSGVAVARGAGTVVVTGPSLPAAETEAEDGRLATARKEAGVSALLHEDGPVRYWDHDLGPTESRLFRADLADAGSDGLAVLRDLTPAPGRALDERSPVVAPDGSLVVSGWGRPAGRGEVLADLVAVPTDGAEQRILAQAGGGTGPVDFGSPSVSPDGRWVAAVRELGSAWDEIPRVGLWLVDLATGEGRELAPGWDLRPASTEFTADSAAVLVVADEAGHRPVFRVEVATGAVTRLTRDGAYSSLCPSPDARHVFALRSSIAEPPAAVRLAPEGTDQDPVRLPAVPVPAVPGRVEAVHAAAADGTPLRAWLVLPSAASAESPAPFLLWVHGGPLGSWNDWSWRWNPHVMAARGWAVLLPDPALSTGYGDGMIRRGWGRWGAEPFTDLMEITDAALQRPDLDGTRTAVMGGSFGGYMANWVAGHTDRFRAVVTHASLWALDQFVPTTDYPAYWSREFGEDPLATPERYEAWSPHRFADRIRTPMLVVHGDRDYRVPIGEGLRLWRDLQRVGVPAKFLYFPDENHWVLTPGNARVWYAAVLAFLDHHVLGAEWVRPELL